MKINKNVQLYLIFHSNGFQNSVERAKKHEVYMAALVVFSFLNNFYWRGTCSSGSAKEYSDLAMIFMLDLHSIFMWKAMDSNRYFNLKGTTSRSNFFNFDAVFGKTFAK